MELHATVNARGAIGAGVHKGQKIVISAPPIESYAVDDNEKMNITYENGDTAVINPVEGVISLAKLRAIYDELYRKTRFSTDFWHIRGAYQGTLYLAEIMDFIRNKSYFYIDTSGYYVDGYVSKYTTSSAPDVTCAYTRIVRLFFVNPYTVIPEGFCRGCGNLQTVDWTNNATAVSVGAHAFDGCMNLQLHSPYFDVFERLPDTIRTIGDYAFYGCDYFNPDRLPDSLQAIGAYAFSSSSTTSVSVTALALTALPAGLTSIGKYAFYNNQYLAIRDIPVGVTTISDCTFWRCYGITRINMPGVNRITSASVSATLAPFGYCTSLTEVTIGSVGQPVSEIMRYAFRYCNALTKIKVYTNGSLATTYAPWGATNASVEYYDAETGALL